MECFCDEVDGVDFYLCLNCYDGQLTCDICDKKMKETNKQQYNIKEIKKQMEKNNLYLINYENFNKLNKDKINMKDINKNIYNNNIINRLIIKCKGIFLLSKYVNIENIALQEISYFIRYTQDKPFNNILYLLKLNLSNINLLFPDLFIFKFELQK
jgi:hypothetical protein